MTKVITFSRFRVIFPIVSAAIILLGVLITFAGGGLNLGIDFRAGLNIRVQVAPVVARVSYTGEGTASIDISENELVISITESVGSPTVRRFLLSDHSTMESLQSVLAGIAGITLDPVDGVRSPSSFLPLERELAVGSIPVALNRVPVESDRVAIADVRSALSPLGAPQIQTVGPMDANDFMVRIEESEDATDFDTAIAARVSDMLEGEFGPGTVLVRETNYIGARFSANLAQQTVYLSVIALLLILAYTWVRFRLAYAVSAIIALLHDSLFIFAFIGVTGLEFSTATIAAVLTIIGYSLNDTIVIFDRIRENTGVLRSEPYVKIVDASISQSLSRTLMTSVTTLLAVLAIFIFGTGSIKDFALAMIVGVIVGTYSSIFIASPILIGWVSATGKRRKAREAERYGVRDDGAPKMVGSADATEAKLNGAKDLPPTTGKTEAIPQAERKLKGKRKKK